MEPGPVARPGGGEHLRRVCCPLGGASPGRRPGRSEIGPWDPEGREREREGPGGTGKLGPGAGLRVIARKRQASAGVNWQVEEWLRPGVRSAEQWPRAMGSAARLPRVSFLALLPTSCQSLDSNFLYASVSLSVKWHFNACLIRLLPGSPGSNCIVLILSKCKITMLSIKWHWV